MSYFDEVGYGFIGVQTVLPGRFRRRARPIGFIWPKEKPPVVRAKRRKSS